MAKVRTVNGLLKRMHACTGARKWAKEQKFGKNFERMWEECRFTSWLTWMTRQARAMANDTNFIIYDAMNLGEAMANQERDRWNLSREYNDFPSGGPDSSTAYRRHVKWGKHIKPALARAGLL